MERVPDSLKDVQNVVVGQKGGQISKLQVAEFVSSCCSSAELAENRIYEVTTDASADYTPYDDLLKKVPAAISKVPYIFLLESILKRSLVFRKISSPGDSRKNSYRQPLISWKIKWIS